MSNRGQSEAIKEAASLAADLLKNIELSELPLTNMFMKGVRLARLLNDSEMQQTFQYEVSGYPSAPDGVLPEVWKYCAIAKRTYSDKDKEGKVTERANIKSIAELEQQISAASAQLGVATDPNVSISSANPHQFLHGPAGNVQERVSLKNSIIESTGTLARRRAFLYDYVLEKYYELRFSEIAEDVFSSTRQKVDSLIGKFVPGSAQKLVSVFQNLESENPENWANAVHSCRRILQDVADALSQHKQNPKRFKRLKAKKKLSWGQTSTSIG